MAGDGTYTVAADGSKLKNWGSLARVRPAAARAITDVVVECARSGVPVSSSVAPRRGNAELRLLALPVLGPHDEVFGVELWCGRADVEPYPRRMVGAGEWDPDEEIMRLAPALEQYLFGGELKQVRTAPDLFQRIAGFPDRAASFDLAVNFGADRMWCGDIVVRGESSLRQLRAVVRTRSGVGRALRVLAFDISDIVVPNESVEAAALHAVVASTGDTGVGLVSLDYGLVYAWLAAPEPPLHPWTTERVTVHPDDVAAYFGACRDVIDGAARAQVRVRVRFPATEWIAMEAVLVAARREAPAQGIIRVRALDG